MMEQELDLNIVLQAIDPAELSYQEWINVGMGLKQAGYDVDVWDDWSKADNRYHAGECEKKWRSFQGSATPITAGTIVQMALDRGWKPEQPSYELDWSDEIGGRDITVAEQTSWHPAQQLITYLQTLFESSDNVGYVTDVWQNDEGRYLPKKGSYDRTAGQLIDLLSKCGDDIGSVIGDYNPQAGAWIRFNPLDGSGAKNDNVTEYRYALVESDTLPIDQQEKLIREMELPVACLVSSGKKSVHAIVHIDAGTYTEYRQRVQYLYEICKQRGLEVDQQNKNPARLSRMPGVMRNGNRQQLLATNIGKADWQEWKDWIESINDNLPDDEVLSDVWDNLPELAPPLIEGVLRQGHKMLLAGPSKAAKSFALIELCISIAEGVPWLGFQCAQGKVLYVNLELDRASCLHRFRDVYMAAGIRPQNLNNIHIWNLRGKSVPMDSLAPKLIRRAKNKGFIAIIIDPIYKVITGDENSADQMARFCNQFDKVCTELGCATIYCHHHSKGAQGGKRSMDRASGSGVFARDPDALLDLIELEISDDLRKQITGTEVGKLCGEYLAKHDLLDDVSQDDLCSEKALEASRELLSETVYRKLENDAERTRAAAVNRSAWRIEGTLREFPKFPPVNIWFDYPIHKPDSSGVLADIQPEAEQPAWKKGAQSNKKKSKTRKASRKEKVENAIEALSMDGAPSVKDLKEYFADSDGVEPSDSSLRRWYKEAGYTVDKNTGKLVKEYTAND